MDKMGKIRGVEVSRPERSAVPQTLYTPSRQSSASLLELFFLPELSLLPDITIVPAAQGHPAVQISPLCQCQPPRKGQELGLVTACGLVQPAVVSLGPDLESLISDFHLSSPALLVSWVQAEHREGTGPFPHCPGRPTYQLQFLVWLGLETQTHRGVLGYL